MIINYFCFSLTNLWKALEKVLFVVFKKPIPLKIGVKTNNYNEIVMNEGKDDNEDFFCFPSSWFYKGSGSKMDGNTVKLAFDILEKREQKKEEEKEAEEKEKKRLTDSTNAFKGNLAELERETKKMREKMRKDEEAKHCLLNWMNDINRNLAKLKRSKCFRHDIRFYSLRRSRSM